MLDFPAKFNVELRRPLAMRKSPTKLDDADQSKNDQDDQYRAETAGGIIAPSPAIRPRRECADHQNDQDDEKN
jgi:hypothetical protein